MARNNAQPTHSGEGHLAGNLIMFLILFVIFLGAIYSLSFLSLGNAWPMAICLGLFALAYFVPSTITGRSDSHKEQHIGE